MTSMMLMGLDQPLQPAEVMIKSPEGDEVVIRLKAAALNKRDYWITKGKYPGIRFPQILGSDGAGILQGREVIIDPSLDWGPDREYFSPSFRILGMPDHGTMAEIVKVPLANVYDKPGHLSWVEAAALPVCGVTAYRAMRYRGRLARGERVLITGIGGGVASMALLFAVAAGAEVWVTSSSENKIAQAVQHGAQGGLSYTRPEWDRELAATVGGRFDLVIDGAGGSGFAPLIGLMNPRGRMVIYGGTRGNMDSISPQRIFWKQLDILGTSMGSLDDFREMLDFVNAHKIKPVISHVFPLAQANDALALLAKGEQFGKVCLEI